MIKTFTIRFGAMDKAKIMLLRTARRKDLASRASTNIFRAVLQNIDY